MKHNIAIVLLLTFISVGFAQESHLVNMTPAEIIDKSSDYYFGRNGVDRDLDKSRELLLFVASQQGYDALFARVMLIELNFVDCDMVSQYFKQIEREVRQSIISDYSTFMNFLCRHYEEENDDFEVLDNRCTPKDDVISHYWAKTSAEFNDAEGQYLYGRDLIYGIGTNVDIIEGLRWIKKSAEGGYVHSMLVLGECYWYGDYVQKDEKQALLWWKDAARNGMGEAYYCMAGVYYYGGDYIEQDTEEAKKWCKEGAFQFDNANCCWLLSEILYDDQISSERLYALEKAADYDNKDAQAEVAKLHVYELVPNADPEWGIQTLKMLSDEGVSRAMAIYGKLLYCGLVFQSNQAEGTKLIKLSAQDGDRLGIQTAKNLNIKY
jgi:TPR repeat protein